MPYCQDAQTMSGSDQAGGGGCLAARWFLNHPPPPHPTYSTGRCVRDQASLGNMEDLISSPGPAPPPPTDSPFSTNSPLLQTDSPGLRSAVPNLWTAQPLHLLLTQLPELHRQRAQASKIYTKQKWTPLAFSYISQTVPSITQPLERTGDGS